MAFATQEDVFDIAEEVLYETFKKFSDKEVSKPPFKRIPFAEAMVKYGTDKPDLRNPLLIVEISDMFEETDFAPFRKKTVRSINVPNAASQSKKWFKRMEEFALSIGMKGLGYVKVNDDLTLTIRSTNSSRRATARSLSSVTAQRQATLFTLSPIPPRTRRSLPDRSAPRSQTVSDLLIQAALSFASSLISQCSSATRKQVR